MENSGACVTSGMTVPPLLSCPFRATLTGYGVSLIESISQVAGRVGNWISALTTDDEKGEFMKNDEIGERLRRIEELLTAQQPRPLSLPEAAAYLSISKSRMYAYTSKSLIPHFKPNGKKIVFKKADLDAFLYRNRVASVEEIEREV